MPGDAHTSMTPEQKLARLSAALLASSPVDIVHYMPDGPRGVCGTCGRNFDLPRDDYYRWTSYSPEQRNKLVNTTGGAIMCDGTPFHNADS